jgi:hypothetical protein
MCADLSRNSGGIAVFNGADHPEKGPFAHPGPDANLPIAHRLAGFSAYNATLARTIYTILNVSEKKFHVLPACKHGCVFAGALHSSRMGRDMVHNNCLQYPDSRTETRCHLLHDFKPLL